MSFVSCASLLFLTSTLSLFKPVGGQSRQANDYPSSWPHVYPGMPSGGYSPEWQNYFQVTKRLPNVTWPLSRNWAGNIPVQRAGHPNDTLFFWAFESLSGSFTANNQDPWGIWLNGGPGSSSFLGLFFENGPIQILSDYSIVKNTYTWTSIADYVWVDQPVGTGYSTADSTGYIADEDQMGTDFMGFLENFVKVFPHLATRPLYLTGESYAGVYIPYIVKTYFGMNHPPVHLVAIAIGDGDLTNVQTFNEMPVVFEYFVKQSALCGYNLTLQYPQPRHFPTLNAPLSIGASATLIKKQFIIDAQYQHSKRLEESGEAFLDREKRLYARDAWKRDLAGRTNGTIDPWYQCNLYFEMIDYAINFTFPWSDSGEFDPYDIPDGLSPEVTRDASVFLNDAVTRAAIHAPTSKRWQEIIPRPFARTNKAVSPYGDPSVEPMGFLSELATNATKHHVKIVIYSGNDDAIVAHFGSQVAIQNTTFSGIQGFMRKPDTPWYNDAGEFGGIVHQERGWTYVLVGNAGHLLGYTNPVSVGIVSIHSTFTLVREFIFGNNKTGLVTQTSSGTVTVVGGKATSLVGEVLVGQAAIYYGDATTASSHIFPSATIEAWEACIAKATGIRED